MNIKTLVENDHVKICLATCLDANEYSVARGGFSRNELAWIDQKKRDTQKRLSATGILLAREMGGDEVIHDSRGRPAFRNAALDLSISNKSDLSTVAVTRRPFRVGVDIEDLTAIKNPESFKKYFLCDEERNRFPAFTREFGFSDRQMMVTLWSIKESFIKATINTISPVNVWVSSDSLNIRSDGEWRPVDVRKRELHFFSNYVLSAVVLNEWRET